MCRQRRKPYESAKEKASTDCETSSETLSYLSRRRAVFAKITAARQINTASVINMAVSGFSNEESSGKSRGSGDVLIMGWLSAVVIGDNAPPPYPKSGCTGLNQKNLRNSGRY
jgi:hypothetical protein